MEGWRKDLGILDCPIISGFLKWTLTRLWEREEVRSKEVSAVFLLDHSFVESRQVKHRKTEIGMAHQPPEHR